MEPLAVDLLLLRSALTPELRITPGRALMARVVHADGSGRGALSIAGTMFDAQLPKQVRAGQDLRLVVHEVRSDRVVLRLSDEAGTPLVPPPPVPLPGGGGLRVLEHEHRPATSASGARDSIMIRYEAPNLGPVDLRFDLRAGSLRLHVTLDAGEPLRRAQAQVGELRDSLEQSADRDVALRLAARREPLDVYA